jgi:hypothetical protein
VLIVSSVLAYGECTNEMETFNNHQNVIKGMMDMNFQGKLNSENSKAIGERLKEGQAASDEGEYAKACEIYDAIIEDYGFEKVFGVHNEGAEESESEEKAAEATTSESSAAGSSAEDAVASPSGE